MIELEMRDGVALLWLDKPDKDVNTLDIDALNRLEGYLDQLQTDTGCRALAFVSAKANNWLAGVDIELFRTLSTEELLKVGEEGQRLFTRLAAYPKPVIAAVHGACAGGGFELALACHYRIASDHSDTSFSLPEVKLGLMPGLGGTQRLPRLIGLQKALPLLLTGRSVYARQAKRLGIADALHHREGIADAAVTAGQRLSAGQLSAAQRRKSLTERVMESPSASQIVYRAAAREVMKTTRGNYPAPGRIIEAVRTGLERGMPAGLSTETSSFAELARTPEALALMHIFFARAKTRRNPLAADALPVDRVAVLGAGLMGAGIAQVSAAAGLAVTLTDQTVDQAASGARAVHTDVSRRVGKGMTAFDRDRVVGRIALAHGPAAAAGADLTIEAVPEVLALKQDVLRQVEAVTGPAHVYASNTSSIPISLIAEAAARPDRVVGMHYFSPVPRMPLLEIIRGEASSDEAVATAVRVGLAQGKAVITVADRPGFYVNRILAPYMNEAILMLKEGVRIDLIDGAMRDAGFPVGPFRLLDEVGLDVAGSVTKVLAPLFRERGTELEDTATPLLEAGLKGKKGGKGFYDYAKGGRVVNADVYRLLGAAGAAAATREQVRQRLLLALVNEAALALQEGIIADPVDGDIGAVFGMGFPPFLGGPFRYMDAQGLPVTIAELEALEERYGSRFAPAELLREKAAAGRGFHA